MAEFKNYNPKQNFAVFGAILFQQYGEGSFIEVEYNEDAFTTKVGPNGDVVRVASNDKTALITVTLQGASGTNDKLSAIAIADRLGLTVGAGVKPFLIRDLNGTTVIQAANTWIKKIPTWEAGAEHTDRKWVFECAELEMFIGGAIR